VKITHVLNILSKFDSVIFEMSPAQKNVISRKMR